MKKLIANVAKQIPEAVISALLVISSFVVFFVFTGEKNAPWYGFLAGLAALILFDVCAVLTVFKAGNEMREAWAKPRAVAEEAPEAPVLQVLPDMPGARIDKKTKFRDIAIIVLGCAVVCVVCIFACACVVWAHNSTESFEQITRRLFSALDSQHYLYIAENGYTPATYDELGEVVRTEDYGRVVEIVFLPGFPAAVALLGRITGDYFAAGMIVSYVCFALAGVLLYLTVLDEYGREDALFSVLILWLLPGSFFFVAPMTESMFLALTLGTIYCIKKKNH